jgi:hypothetical protein
LVVVRYRDMAAPVTVGVVVRVVGRPSSSVQSNVAATGSAQQIQPLTGVRRSTCT